MKRVTERCAIMGIRDVIRKSAAARRGTAIKKENAKRDARKKDAGAKARVIGEDMAVMKEDIMRKDTEEAIMDMEATLTATGMTVIMMMGDTIINMA
jgi:hypothetical protein